MQWNIYLIVAHWEEFLSYCRVIGYFRKWKSYFRVRDGCSVKKIHVQIPAAGSSIWLLGSAVNDLTDNIAMENPLYIYKLCLKQL